MPPRHQRNHPSSCCSTTGGTIILVTIVAIINFVVGALSMYFALTSETDFNLTSIDLPFQPLMTSDILEISSNNDSSLLTDGVDSIDIESPIEETFIRSDDESEGANHEQSNALSNQMAYLLKASQDEIKLGLGGVYVLPQQHVNHNNSLRNGSIEALVCSDFHSDPTFEARRDSSVCGFLSLSMERFSIDTDYSNKYQFCFNYSNGNSILGHNSSLLPAGSIKRLSIGSMKDESPSNGPSLIDVRRSNTLIVLTTCNQLNYSIISAQFIKSALQQEKIADLIIIDDHSVDGTVEYFTKKGYHIITKPSPMGLTHSWNLAYRLALSLGYNQIIYTNNDILIPAGSLQMLLRELQNNSVVVPLSTHLGAGHNPSQSIIFAWNLSFSFYDYVNNPRHVQQIQNSLTGRYNSKAIRARVPATAPSIWKGKVKFNGFFFGINLQLSRNITYRYPDLLFNDSSIMVGQEDTMVESMIGANIVPAICMYAFVYHYKSVTVQVAGIGYKPDDVDIYRAWYKHKNGSDSREDLSKFHPEMRNGGAKGSLYDTYPKLVFPSIKRYPPPAPKIIIGFMTSDPKRTPYAGDLFTAYELATSLEASYSNVEVRFIARGWDWYRKDNLKDLDVIVSFLDAWNPSFAMGMRHDRFETRPKFGNTFAIGLETKPALITIAWMRNWFQKWLTVPYLGNFDLLLVSSTVAKDFYDVIGSRIGFRVSCYINCVGFLLPKNLTILLDPLVGSNQTSSLSGSEGLLHLRRRPFLTLSSSRLDVPVKTLRLATNDLTFNPNASSFQSQVDKKRFSSDYIFPGSYYKVKRPIMNFSPKKFSTRHKGLLIGSNWKLVKNVWDGFVEDAVPYSTLPQVYASTKVVLDDASGVTRHWGSVNSRVFDAIASGCLVITNSQVGNLETFSGELPTYGDMSELEKVLKYYLRNDTARAEKVDMLYHEVRTHHTYRQRAKELAGHLKGLGVDLVPRRDPILASEPGGSDANRAKTTPLLSFFDPSRHSLVRPLKKSICVGVRTIAKQLRWLELLVGSLLVQQSMSKYQSKLGIELYISNTEEDVNGFHKELKALCDRFNAMHDYPIVFLLSDEFAQKRVYPNRLYGYDVTDAMLDYMLDQPQCEWVMFTNGDNMYNSAWFDSIAPHALKANHMIGWDFVTHHPRAKGANGEMVEETTISVALERGKVDLGCVIVRSALYRITGTRFIANAVFTGDVFARDYFAIANLAAFVRQLNEPKPMVLVHQVLMFHQ